MTSITTTGTTTDPVETEHQSGQSTREWVGAHSGSVAAATPSGNTLTTTWYCSEDPDSSEGSTTTTRQDGEMDAEFIARHINEYVLDMLNCVPVP